MATPTPTPTPTPTAPPAVSDILTDVRYEIADTAKTEYSDAELFSYVNEAIRRIVARVAREWPKFWMNTGENYRAVYNIVADQASYRVPGDYYLMLEVHLTDSTGNTQELDPISLNRSYDSDEDNGYTLRGRRIYLYPVPDTAVTSGLELYYISKPANVTALADTLWLAEWFYDTIKEYVVLKCKARQGEKIDDFASFYQMLVRDVSPAIERTNRSRDGHGLNMQWRDWV